MGACPNQIHRHHRHTSLVFTLWSGSVEVENSPSEQLTPHTTHHYVPLLLPLETASVCVLIAPNVNFSYPCEDGEMECAHNGSVLLEEGGSKCNVITENPTPPTQQFVSGQMVSMCCVKQHRLQYYSEGFSEDRATEIYSYCINIPSHDVTQTQAKSPINFHCYKNRAGTTPRQSTASSGTHCPQSL